MVHSLEDTKIKKIPIISYRIFIKGVKFLFKHNPQETLQKTKSVLERESRIINYNQSYKKFLRKNKLTPETIKIETQKIKQLKLQPKVSILMPTYNSPHKFLKINIESVINQIYSNWELCIADDNSSDKKVREIIKEYALKDKRIKYILRKKNGHISKSTNSALELATGEYVALLDHDDIIYPNTLSECIKKLNKYPKADLIYTDEDKITIHGHRFEPHFKPDWSPETLLSGNYITHFAIIKKKIIDKLNGFRVGYEGAQDLDLFLRISDITNNIYHVPKILYSWRTIPTSTASAHSNAKCDYAYQNGAKAVQDCLDRRKLKGVVKIGEGKGLYQYFIESKNKTIDFFILKNRSNFTNKNLIKDLQKEFPNSKIESSSKTKLGQKVLNFIQKSKSDYIFFLDNQCYLTSKSINNTIGYFKIKPIKIVTNKITDAYNKIYKTGIIIIKNEHLNPIDAFYGMTDGGYFNFNYSKMTKNFSSTSLLGTAINTKYFQTKNLIKIKKLTNFKEIGMYLSYLIDKKNRIVYNPNFSLIYKGKYINNQINIVITKKHDPYYNPNLTLNKSDFSIKI